MKNQFQILVENKNFTDNIIKKIFWDTYSDPNDESIITALEHMKSHRPELSTELTIDIIRLKDASVTNTI